MMSICDHDYSMIVLVGEGMRHTKGLAARAALPLLVAGVSIEMINQGSSEVSLVFGVHKERRNKNFKRACIKSFSENRYLCNQ